MLVKISENVQRIPFSGLVTHELIHDGDSNQQQETHAANRLCLSLQNGSAPLQQQLLNSNLIATNLAVSNASAASGQPMLESLSPCPPWCNCRCHKRLRWASPRLLTNILGHWLVGYSGSLWARQPCSEELCQARAAVQLGITYTFPPWITLRMLQMQFALSPLNGVSLFVKTPRVISITSEIFTYARYGDVEGMVQLFRAGRASPFDVKEYDGLSALQASDQDARVECAWR